MSKRAEKTHKGHSTKKTSMLHQDLVIITTAESIDEAKEYETLLKNNDIPAMVKQQQDEFTEVKRFAVFVPEEMADEATVIIESQDSYDDFYDSAMDDDGEDDLEGEILED